MNKSLHILLYGIIIAISAYAYADSDNDLNDIYKQMKPSFGMTADFEQVKIITVLSHPLFSKGTVFFVDTETINWRQTIPYRVEMNFTPKGIIECLDDCKGKMPATISNPFVTALSQAFVSLLAGSPKQLEAYFDITAKEQGQEGWQLSLTSIDPMLSDVIKQINLTGDEYLRSLHIYEMNGDHTLLTFSNHHTAVSTMSEIK